MAEEKARDPTKPEIKPVNSPLPKSTTCPAAYSHRRVRKAWKL